MTEEEKAKLDHLAPMVEAATKDMNERDADFKKIQEELVTSNPFADDIDNRRAKIEVYNAKIKKEVEDHYRTRREMNEAADESLSVEELQKQTKAKINAANAAAAEARAKAAEGEQADVQVEL